MIWVGDGDGWMDAVIAEGKRSGGGKWLGQNGKNTGPELASVGEATLPFTV